MLVIAVLTIVSFIWFYSPLKRQGAGAGGSDSIGTIYDRDLTQTEVDKQNKYYQLSLMLGQYDLLKDLAGTAQSENEARMAFILNSIVLRHEAEALGVKPTGDQIVERVQSLPIFQTNGQYDPIKYQRFTTEQLGPRGLVVDNILETAGDALRLEAVKNIVSAPAAVTPAEVKDAARIFQKVDLQTIKLPLSAAEAGVVVPPEEVQAFYQKNAAQMMARETRTVEYVEFALPAEQKADGKVAAQQKLVSDALDFAKKAGGTSFESAAAAVGRTVQTSPEFDQTGASNGIKDDNASEILKGIAPAAFQLSDQKPTSTVQQVGDNFYVVKLVKVSPQHALTFDEVKPILEQNLKAMKARQVLQANGIALIAKIREQLTAGKSFADAAAALGLKPEVITGLDFTSESLKPEQQGLARASMLLEPGQVSNLLPDADGGYAVYLTSRAPLDPAKQASAETDIAPRILETKRDLLFSSWLASAQEAAKVSFNQRGQ